MITQNSKEYEFKQYKPDEQRLQRIIKEGDAIELNKYADELGKGLRYELWIKEVDTKTSKEKIKKEKELTSSQIRSVLDNIQRMRIFDKDKLQLVRPKLAYVAGRHGGRVREFQGIVDKAIQLVSTEKEFERFKDFIEAIVAYHRYHGGE